MSCSTNTPISMIIKRKQWYLLSLICVFFVLPIPKAKAGFCWSLDNSGNCTLESNNGNVRSEDHDFGIRDPNTKLTMDSPALFDFVLTATPVYLGAGDRTGNWFSGNLNTV